MKRSISIIAMSMCCTQLLHAQSTIQGITINEKGQPLPGVSILLLHTTDSALVKGIVSSKTGYYLLTNVPAGKYLLAFSFVGFRTTYSSSYTIGAGDHINTGETTLIAEGAQLDKVTVVAKKPLFEQRMDRLIVNVRNSITAAGGTVLDVLERSPGIAVDRQNNTISMGGKEGVLVMINGKENHMPVEAVIQMLAGMNSANVEKIELITTPPANYNAEGSAGIINIVLIENNSVGTNGAYTLAAGIGKNKLASANINFNHRKGKINLYGDGSVAFNDMDQPVNGYRRIDFAGVRKEAYTTNQRDASTLNFSGRLGIDVQLSKKTVAGALVSGYRNKWTMTSTSDASFLSNQQADTLIRGSIDEINLWKNIAVNLNVQHTFKKDHKLTVNADYLWYHDDNPNNYFNKWFNGMNDFLYDQEIVTQKKTPISFWVGSADYSGKLGKHIDWQAGGKFTLSGFDNDILIVRSLQHTWVTDSSLSANYTLKENISAAYISFTAGLGRKTTIKWGVRYEYTNSNLGTTTLKNIVDRHYGKLFPSFFISRKINDNSNVNFSYSRRITRPGFNDMAPFTIFFDPNSITTGNPALQPSISDAVSAGYTYSSYLFSLSYSYEAGAITRFQANIDPATNKQVSTPENLDNLKTLAFIMSVPFNPTKWWSMQNNFTGRWQQANTIYKTTTAITVAKYSFRFTSTQSFKLPKDFSIDLSGFYQSTDLSGRTQRLPQMIVDAGVQKKMANNKGKLSFTVADVFSSLRARLYTDLPSQNLLSTRTFKFSQRMFRLTWTRSFGNSKMENKRSRLDNLEEEKRRVE